MLRVFRQGPPIPLGQRFTRIDSEGHTRADEWCAANLQELGTVRTWAEAKKLTGAPIVEKVAAATGD